MWNHLPLAADLEFPGRGIGIRPGVGAAFGSLSPWAGIGASWTVRADPPWGIPAYLGNFRLSSNMVVFDMRRRYVWENEYRPVSGDGPMLRKLACSLELEIICMAMPADRAAEKEGNGWRKGPAPLPIRTVTYRHPTMEAGRWGPRDPATPAAD
jgi:hypothetical protein